MLDDSVIEEMQRNTDGRELHKEQLHDLFPIPIRFIFATPQARYH